MIDVNSPLKIGKKTIKNRITMAPTVKFYAEENGIVTDEFVHHYEERAKHDVGLIVVEATCIAKDARLHSTQLGLWCDEQIEGHKKLADAVHKYGTLVIPQIHHGGLGTSLECGPLTSPTKVTRKRGDKEVEANELTIDDIHKVKKDFTAAALRAKKAGYDGVQVHGCHGYLINDFASEINKRTDEYGGSLENKARLGCEVIRDIREACGDDFIISMRISGSDPTPTDSLEIAEYYVKAGCDFLQVSDGLFDMDSYPHNENLPYNEVAELGVKMHEHFKGRIPVSCVNGFITPESVRYMFENDLVDAIDIARGLLADPAFTEGILYDAPYIKCFHCKDCAFSPRHQHACPAMKSRGDENRF